jgi:hypothetical protein
MNKRDDFLRQAHRKYPSFLASLVSGEPFFPLPLQIGKARLARTYDELRRQLQVFRETAEELGIDVRWKESAHRRFGTHHQPVSAGFGAEAAYTKALGKCNEVIRFRRDVAVIMDRFPEWRPWLVANPLKVVAEAENWERLVAAVAWLRAHPESGLYLRQLPIAGLDTKFIESRIPLLDELLAFPEPGVGRDQFRRRWGLREEEPLLRFRFLDERWRIALGFPEGVRDLALPRSQVAALNLEGADLIVVENLRNYLCLPDLKNVVALSGGGDGVMAWKEVPWLRTARVWYWGDLDAHGLAILARLRGFLPAVRSLLMTREALAAHRSLAVADETEPPVFDANFLTQEEQEVWKILREERLRLEQERVPMHVVHEVIAGAWSGLEWRP